MAHRERSNTVYGRGSRNAAGDGRETNDGRALSYGYDILYIAIIFTYKILRDTLSGVDRVPAGVFVYPRTHAPRRPCTLRVCDAIFFFKKKIFFFLPRAIPGQPGGGARERQRRTQHGRRRRTTTTTGSSGGAPDCDGDGDARAHMQRGHTHGRARTHGRVE
jgi:hypothetical protein